VFQSEKYFEIAFQIFLSDFCFLRVIAAVEQYQKNAEEFENISAKIKLLSFVYIAKIVCTNKTRLKCLSSFGLLITLICLHTELLKLENIEHITN
jgi:hypothetical protein